MPRRCEMKSATSAPPRAGRQHGNPEAEPQIRHEIVLRQAERVGADPEEGAVPERGQPA